MTGFPSLPQAQIGYNPMLAHRFLRRPSIEPSLGQRVAFGGQFCDYGHTQHCTHGIGHVEAQCSYSVGAFNRQIIKSEFSPT